MSIYTTTAQQAIREGLKTVSRPAAAIMLVTPVLWVLLMILIPSVWVFLVLPLGLLFSVVYTAIATPRWRIRAYGQVDDIHQLQRSAELAGLLKLQSHDKGGGLMSRQQKQQLKELQQRFSENVEFVDDTSIPAKTVLNIKKIFTHNNQPLVLSNTGIQVQYYGFYSWDKISNERIAHLTSNRVSPRTGLRISAGANREFRFEYATNRFAVSLPEMGISVWELDLLLYTYRGRYNRSNKPDAE